MDLSRSMAHEKSTCASANVQPFIYDNEMYQEKACFILDESVI